MANEIIVPVSTVSYNYILQDLATKKFYKLNKWRRDELTAELNKMTRFISPENWKQYIKDNNLTNVRILPLRTEHKIIYEDAKNF